MSTASIAFITVFGIVSPANAQFVQGPTADQDLQLAADSPFRDPDIIYLEADTLTNDETEQVLTAQGEVEGRYQDKTLRADKVVYHLGTGQVFADVARGKDGEIELYNAYYTACEVCEDKQNPSWRLKARQVTQNNDNRTVEYRDAVFELFGLPIFYTPYLAHPDPTQDRASGI